MWDESWSWNGGESVSAPPTQMSSQNHWWQPKHAYKGMANIQTKQMLAVYLKHSWKSTVKWNHSKHIECIQVHPKSWAIRDQIVNHSFSCFGQCWNQKFLHVQYCIPTIITRKTAPHLMQCHQNLPTAQPQLKSAKRNHDTHKRTINRNTQWPKSQYQRF